MKSGSQRILMATKNQGKMREAASYMNGIGIEIVSPEEVNPALIPDVAEDGQTFTENALKKAQAYQQIYQLPVLADDSGLEVDALGGAPGVYSARYAGDDQNDQANNQKLLKELKGVPWEQRTAHFTSVIAYVHGSAPPIIVTGKCAGYITDQPCGEEGFGYDPLFYLPEFQQTMAQISTNQKNRISHRGQALRELVGRLT